MRHPDDIARARAVLASHPDPACRRVAAELDRLMNMPPPSNDIAHDPAMDMGRRCVALGITPTWDGYVRTADAAALLGMKSTGTLRNWRSAIKGPAYRKARGGSGHVEYSIAELARPDLWQK